MEFNYPEGATPLNPETIRGLIPRLTTQGELNEFEHTNIQAAMEWAAKSRTLKRDLTTVYGIKLLHQKMFENN